MCRRTSRRSAASPREKDDLPAGHAHSIGILKQLRSQVDLSLRAALVVAPDTGERLRPLLFRLYRHQIRGLLCCFDAVAVPCVDETGEAQQLEAPILPPGVIVLDALRTLAALRVSLPVR